MGSLPAYTRKQSTEAASKQGGARCPKLEKVLDSVTCSGMIESEVRSSCICYYGSERTPMVRDKLGINLSHSYSRSHADLFSSVEGRLQAEGFKWTQY